MRQISTDNSFVDEISENAFDFIEIHRDVQPLKHSAHLLKRDLMLFGHFVDTLKETAIAHGSAPFKQQVGALPSQP